MAYPREQSKRAQFWRRQIRFSEKVLMPWFEEGRRILKLYENEPTTDRERILEDTYNGGQNIGRAKPSLTFGWIDQSIANMLARNPKFRVEGKRGDTAEGEVPVAECVDYHYENTNQIHQDRRVLLDAFTYPFGIKKAGWVSDVIPEGEERLSDAAEVQFADPEEENLFLGAGTPTIVTRDHDHIAHLEAHEPLLVDPTISDEIKDTVIRPHIDEHKELLGEADADTHKDIQVNHPFGIRWNPEDFRIDPLAMDGLNDARWIAFKSVKPIEEVKDNPNYRNTKEIKGSRISINNPHGTPNITAPEPDKGLGDDDGFNVVTVWEVWARNFPISSNRRADILVVFAENGSDDGENVMLRQEDEWPYDRINGYPASMLSFLQGNRTWLQKPILALSGFDNMQALLNETLDAILANVRAQKTVILYDDGIIDEDAMQVAIMAPDQTPIAVPGLATVGAGAVVPLPVPDNPGDRASWMDMIMGLADRAAGSPTPGGANESDTATEAAIDERRTTARESVRADLFENYQVHTAELFWRMHTQFRPDYEVFIHPDLPKWSDADIEQVKNGFRFAIDVSSAATAQALERRQWMEVANLATGSAEVFVSLGMAPPNLPKIYEALLVRGFGIQNPEAYFPALEQAAQQPGGLTPQGVNGIVQGGANGIPEGGPQVPEQFGQGTPSEINTIAESVTV